MAEVIFPGPAGRVEGRYSEGKRESAPIALILQLEQTGFCGPGARARAKESRLSGFDGFGSSSASTGDAFASANIAARRRSCAL